MNPSRTILNAVRACAVILLTACVSPAWCLDGSPDSVDQVRVRARALGLHPGQFQPGPLNAITDVPGVKVGQVTLMQGDGPLQPGQGPLEPASRLSCHGMMCGTRKSRPDPLS
jgi:D-aminopeptidase